MSASQAKSWSRAFAACPHCARTVLFDAEGVCPSCHIRGDAPVTEADTARIARDKQQDHLRAQPRPPEGAFATGFLATAVLGVPALVWAHWGDRGHTVKRGARYGLLFHALLLGLFKLAGHLAG